jgi:hypothetical protein
VLEPELRTNKGARSFAQHLLTKAAERLRRGDYYCRRLGLHISWVGDLGGWWDETDFHETRDTGFLVARLDELWPRAPRYKPLSVGVVLLDLVPAAMHQPDLFAADTQRRQKLSPLIDRINDRYGRCAIGFGLARIRQSFSGTTNCLLTMAQSHCGLPKSRRASRAERRRATASPAKRPSSTPPQRGARRRPSRS